MRNCLSMTINAIYVIFDKLIGLVYGKFMLKKMPGAGTGHMTSTSTRITFFKRGLYSPPPIPWEFPGIPRE